MEFTLLYCLASVSMYYTISVSLVYFGIVRRTTDHDD